MSPSSQNYTIHTQLMTATPDATNSKLRAYALLILEALQPNQDPEVNWVSRAIAYRNKLIVDDLFTSDFLDGFQRGVELMEKLDDE